MLKLRQKDKVVKINKIEIKRWKDKNVNFWVDKVLINKTTFKR